MLIEILKPIYVDGKPICETFRVNLVHDVRKLRCKITFANSEPKTGTTLVDLNVYEYSLPKIDGLGISISFRGKEMETGLTFEAVIGYKLSKKSWYTSGKIGPRTFKMESKQAVMIIDHIRQIIMPAAEVNISALPIAPATQPSHQTNINPNITRRK